MTEFFLELLKNDRAHAAFLNSLSYLEYRGARKISRALATMDIDPEVLRHASEEARHAFYFKTLAIKLGGSDFNWYQSLTLFAGEAFKSYFYELDHAVGHLRATAKERYLRTTWLVEERAMAVYELYDDLLACHRPGIRLSAVLKDESRHLEFVRSLIPEVERSHLKALEASLFAALQSELERGLKEWK